MQSKVSFLVPEIECNRSGQLSSLDPNEYGADVTAMIGTDSCLDCMIHLE